jgi:hypothetical protein
MDDSLTEQAGFRKGEVPIEKAVGIAEAAQRRLMADSEAVLIVGSVRRQEPLAGDVDLLVLPKDLHRMLRALEKEGFKGTDRMQRKMVNGVLLELYLAHSANEMGALELFTTGDRSFMDHMRSVAREQHWTLDRYALLDDQGKTILQSPDERDYFDALGVAWLAPEERSSWRKERPSPSMGAGKRQQGELFPGIKWDFTPFRPPDREDEGKMIWYGPAGPGGREASLIRYRTGGWSYTEYSSVEGRAPHAPAPIVSVTTVVTYADLQQAELEKSQIEIPRSALERSPDAWARFAAVIGAVRIGLYGGQMKWVDQLP